MAEEDSTFRVTDRRHRSEEEEVPPAPPAAPPGNRPGSVRAEPSPPPAPPPGLDLVPIFAMFATSALVGLGEAGDPAGAAPRVDLTQARDAIDALIVLRQKTEGNRTPEESRVLEEVLYDLQMRYVTVARRGRG